LHAYHHLAMPTNRSLSHPNTVGATRGKTKDSTAKAATAAPKWAMGMGSSARTTIWLLSTNQHRPASGTEKNSEPTAAARRPPRGEVGVGWLARAFVPHGWRQRGSGGVVAVVAVLVADAGAGQGLGMPLLFAGYAEDGAGDGDDEHGGPDEGAQHAAGLAGRVDVRPHHAAEDAACDHAHDGRGEEPFYECE